MEVAAAVVVVVAAAAAAVDGQRQLPSVASGPETWPHWPVALRLVGRPGQLLLCRKPEKELNLMLG